MKKYYVSSLSKNKFHLFALGILTIILTFGISDGTQAFGDNVYYNIQKTNLVENSWNHKAQGMIKIASVGDENRILIVENFVSNSNNSFDIYVTSETNLEKRKLLGEINMDSNIHFFPIPNDISFSEYDTIEVRDKISSLVYGKAMILS